MREASLHSAGAALGSHLSERRAEIEEAILTRIYAVADPSESGDPEYVDGLRNAVAAAIDYAFAAIESDDPARQPVPAALLVQARIASRNGVGLDTVLRRYFAGFSLLIDFLIEQSEAGGLLNRGDLRQLLRTHAPAFDRLIAAVSEEHAREAKSRRESTERRRAELVQRLLDGELANSSELSYDFDAHHVGLVATGPGVAEALPSVAHSMDRRLLAVTPMEETVWAWLGGRRPFESAEIEQLASMDRPPSSLFTIGEPGRRFSGWRLSHRQARAALPVAARSPVGFARYREVALLASILQDDLLATSLRGLYLAPLTNERDGGETLRETLRAYCSTEGHVSSAAAALGVNRHTVTKRLRVIEERIGRPLGECMIELEAALRLERLDRAAVVFCS